MPMRPPRKAAARHLAGPVLAALLALGGPGAAGGVGDSTTVPRPGRGGSEPAPGEVDLFAMPAIADQTRAAFGLVQAGDLGRRGRDLRPADRAPPRARPAPG